MSNFVSVSLNETVNHNLKMGDYMIKQYGNKQIKFTFYFNENGKDLRDILEQCYRSEIRNEQILIGGRNEFKKLKNDSIIQL